MKPLLKISTAFLIASIGLAGCNPAAPTLEPEVALDPTTVLTLTEAVPGDAGYTFLGKDWGSGNGVGVKYGLFNPNIGFQSVILSGSGPNGWATQSARITPGRYTVRAKIGGDGTFTVKAQRGGGDWGAYAEQAVTLRDATAIVDFEFVKPDDGLPAQLTFAGIDANESISATDMNFFRRAGGVSPSNPNPAPVNPAPVKPTPASDDVDPGVMKFVSKNLILPTAGNWTKGPGVSSALKYSGQTLNAFVSEQSAYINATGGITGFNTLLRPAYDVISSSGSSYINTPVNPTFAGPNMTLEIILAGKGSVNVFFQNIGGNWAQTAVKTVQLTDRFQIVYLNVSGVSQAQQIGIGGIDPGETVLFHNAYAGKY